MKAHAVGQKIDFLRFLRKKCPSLCYFLTNFDEDAHEGLFSDGDSESVPILNVLTTKLPITLLLWLENKNPVRDSVLQPRG